jgi:hypothetical protein
MYKLLAPTVIFAMTPIVILLLQFCVICCRVENL